MDSVLLRALFSTGCVVELRSAVSAIARRRSISPDVGRTDSLRAEVAPLSPSISQAVLVIGESSYPASTSHACVCYIS